MASQQNSPPNSPANIPAVQSGENPWALSRWMAAAFVCVGAALLIELGTAAWGVWHDLSVVRTTFIQSEMNRLRTHAVRTVAMAQDRLRETAEVADLISLQNYEELRQHWNRHVLIDESRAYASITDSKGTIIAHSQAQRQGMNIGTAWYERTVEEAGDDVVETQNPALTGGERAYDVRVPIYEGGQEIGSYHSGLDLEWLEERLATKQSTVKRRWGVIMSVIVIVVIVAGGSLFNITRRLTMFGEAMKVARLRRFAEVGQLMAGIVHEIRNPLNAMRLNMHVLGRIFEQRASLNHFATEDGSDEAVPIIRETNREIERVEELMRVLLGYARPDQPRDEPLDVHRELQVTLGFLKPVLERAEVAVHLHVTDRPMAVQMDRDRLRQIMLNLINNAKDATGPGGVIHVDVTREEPATVVIAVADNGPGVSPAERERIFEPFYSTKELGTGLGLALVKRFVEEAGGDISCERNQPRGARFVLRLAELSPFDAKPIAQT